LFGVAPRFDAPETAHVLEASALGLRIVGSQPGLVSYLDAYARDVNSRLPADGGLAETGEPMTAERRQDPACIFCQIVAGARAAEIVFESATTVAFLDRFPVARGHTLVVPRQHAATLLELDRGAVGALFGSVSEVVESLAERLRPTGFNVGWNHGAAAGQHVFHLHVHILPRFHGGGSGVQAVGEGAPEGPLEEIAEIIRGGRAPRQGDASQLAGKMTR